MNPFKRCDGYGLAAGESGQMAVFVALIFQVLFVFFAMVVNIGLLVHDKINLQNSVDLGAYYGAQRQAEMLNEIAHLNYGIRQDYKLLAWRMRVLGGFGRTNHPQNSPGPYPDTIVPDPTVSERIGFCIAHQAWAETAQLGPEDNMCQRVPDNTIPQIPPINVIIDFGGLNAQIAGIFEGFRQSFRGRCNAVGPMNWVFGATSVGFFRLAVSSRKRMIAALSSNLSAPIGTGGQDFRDQEMRPVYEGIRATIEKNLTQANKDGLDIVAINGLAEGGCGQPANNYPYWLRQISINPVLFYINFQEANGCTPIITPLNLVPGVNGTPGDFGIVQSYGPALQAYATGEPQQDGDPMRSTRGFEKNPWCMAYVGVKATSTPRKPFSPFGSPIQLSARSFAQPFGGRIGPWDKNGWAPGTDFSSGAPIDPLAVARSTPGLPPPNPNGPEQNSLIPNYSRFPGDPLGLKSILAMAATRPALVASLVANPGRKLTIQDFSHLQQVEQTGDVLAFDPTTQTGSWVRLAEVAAVSPDIFDATYYSIEPDYYNNYHRLSENVTRPRYEAPLLPAPISDVGSRRAHPTLASFAVRNQIALAHAPAGISALLPDVFWSIVNKEHLLTGWNQNGAVDYSFPTQYFGRCYGAPGMNQPAATGDCFAGGRTGYSVRLIHREYLMHPSHRLGGEDQGTGPIRNRPPPTF